MSFVGSMMPVFWLVLGIAMAVTEGITVQLNAIWFALGAVVAAVSAALGASVRTQWILFAGVSLAALLATRPFVRKVVKTCKEPTNADRVIGKTGVVTQTVDNLPGMGRVSVLGMDWSARTQDGEILEEGERVQVLAIEGVTLIVAAETAQHTHKGAT